MKCMHKASEPFAWLEGTWRTESLDNSNLIVKDFDYHEEISFKSLGKSMFNFTAQSFSNSDLKKPMYRERGFLKVDPETNQVILISAENYGLTMTEYGNIIDKTMRLAHFISDRSYKWAHRDTMMYRKFKFHDNCLEYTYHLSYTEHSIRSKFFHLKYVKVNEEA